MSIFQKFLMLCLLASHSLLANADFSYEVYDGNFEVLPDFSTLTPEAAGTSASISLDVATQTDTFALVFTNQITIPVAGTYTFALSSDDGSKLIVASTTVIDHDGLHGASIKEGEIFLAPGTYDFRLEYFEQGGGESLSISYKSEGGVYSRIPADGVLNNTLLQPTGGTSSAGGFEYQYYEGTFDKLPDFTVLSPVSTGTSDAIDISVATLTDHYALVFSNQLTVTTAGTYTFKITSDDGSILSINNQVVIDNDGLHGPIAKESAVYLVPGVYDLTVEYLEATGSELLEVSYKSEGGVFVDMPADGVLTDTLVAPTQTGVFNYQVYDGDFNQLPDFSALTPIDSGTSNTIGVDVTDQLDTFALVFTNKLTVFNEGTYTFQLTSDDGSRLLINGVTIVDHDGLHSASAKEGQVVLSPGVYDLRVEYFEKGGGQSLIVAYKAEGGIFATIPANGELAETVVTPTGGSSTGTFSYQVFDGDFDQLPDFSALTPIAEGTSAAIGVGVTDQADTFALVFENQITVSKAGNYTFQLTSDDGSKLLVGGTTVVDHDGLHGATTKEGQIFLNPGVYDLRIEYFEKGGGQSLAVAYKTEGTLFAAIPADGVLMETTVTPTGGSSSGVFNYEVYDGDFNQLPDFSSLTPVDTGTSNTIGLAVTDLADTFALVFTNQITVENAGTYTFQLVSDDGSSLSINGTMVIDHDGLHGATAKEGQIFLNPGVYDLRVEYFEKGGGESLSVAYKFEGGVFNAIPSDGVLTSTGVTPTDGASGGAFSYQVYDGDFNQLPDFSSLTPIDTGNTSTISLGVTDQVDTFALVFENQITVSSAGNYHFQLASDDGSKLLIGGVTVVDHDGLHGATTKEGQIFLNPGVYDLRVEYFEKGGGQLLSVAYKAEGGIFAAIPADGVLTDSSVDPSASGVFDYSVYEGVFSQLPDFSGLTPVSTGSTDTITLEFIDLTENFAVVFDNQITVTTEGTYSFRLLSDDGSKLYINGNVVVNNDGFHTAKTVTGEVFLTPGTYDFRVEYFEGTGDQTLSVEYKVANGIYRTIPANGQLDGAIPKKNVVGEWGEVIAWPHIAVSTANLPDGRILTWAGSEIDSTPGLIDFTFASIYDPSNNTFDEANNTIHSMFCAGLTTLENGNIVASGGNLDTVKTSFFDLQTQTWQPLQDMFDARWYGTNVTLPNNQIFSTYARSAANRSEKFDPASNQWVSTPNADMQDLVDEQNAKIAAGADMQWYAAMTVQPDGKIFHAGPTPTFHVFDPVGGQNEQAVGQLTGSRARMWANAVNYDVGKLLLVGGSDRSVVPFVTRHNAYLVDLNGPTPVIETAAPMHFGRAFSDSVVLPNGDVLVSGGNREGLLFDEGTAVLPAEIYRPSTNTWTIVDGLSVPRTYHSTATLMRDGRVLAAGGGACGDCPVNHLDGQIFSPPYLFNEDGSAAPRPTVNGVPQQAMSGDSFNVTASADTTRFTLVRLSAHTHHLNTDHRFVPVDATSDGNGGFQLALNANPNVLLPGNYWLFAVNANGTPSIGQNIQIVRHPDTTVSVDSDNDGVPDNLDVFPNDPNETQDTDGDGIGNNSDPTPTSNVNEVALPTAPRNASTLIVETSSGSDRVWNVNPDNHSVSVSNGAAALLAEIPVGNRPWSLARAPGANQVFVTNKQDASISVIDTSTLTVVQTVPLPFASQPHGLVFNSAGTEYFVILEALAVVQKRDASTHAVIAQTQLTGQPRYAAMAYDDSKLLVSNFITPPVPGESTANVDVANGAGQVFVINPSTMALTNTIGLSHDNSQVSESRGPGMPNYVNAPVISFNNQFAVVPSKKDNIKAGALRGALGITFDQTVRANASILDLINNTESTSRLDFDNASVATGAAISGDNRYLIVALETSRELVIYDLVGGFELSRLHTGRAPQGVALSSDGSVIYVHNFMDRSISAYGFVSGLLTQSPVLEPVATETVVSNEQLSASVFNGKRLFYDAADDRLARDNYMSCASCHNEGDDDGRVWDFTSLGEGLRNTIALKGRAGIGHGFLHWTANFDEVQDFEGQIRQLAGGSGLMTNEAFNAGTTAEPLGDPKAGHSADLDDLAAYVGSLNQFDPSPYSQEGALTTSAQLGKQVFINHNCAACHGGVNFSLSGNASALVDIGTLKASSGTRLSEELLDLDIPTLRDVWTTAPYLHDGSALTLQEAVSAHNLYTLSTQEIDQVVNYMLQIGNGEPGGPPAAVE